MVLSQLPGNLISLLLRCYQQWSSAVNLIFLYHFQNSTAKLLVNNKKLHYFLHCILSVCDQAWCCIFRLKENINLSNHLNIQASLLRSWRRSWTNTIATLLHTERKNSEEVSTNKFRSCYKIESALILIAVSNLLLIVPNLKINADATMRLNGCDDSSCTSWSCRTVLNFELEQWEVMEIKLWLMWRRVDGDQTWTHIEL